MEKLCYVYDVNLTYVGLTICFHVCDGMCLRVQSYLERGGIGSRLLN